MTKEVFNKVLVKYQKAGISVKITDEKQLSDNYKIWNLRFQNGTRVIKVVVGYNIHNDEIATKMASGQRTDIYRVGQLLGLKFVVEI